MSYRQEVECPQCKHKHFAPMDIIDLYHKRNQVLEKAFRDIFTLCVRQVPIENQDGSTQPIQVAENGTFVVGL